MQVNDSRLMKAAKRTIRAEINLIIVIVILTSWSIYALYKLAIGGSDSLLGISFSRSTNDQIDTSITDRQKISRNYSLIPGFVKNNLHDVESAQFGNQPQEATSRHVDQQLSLVPNHKLSEQLAHYKSQILKELMNRQQEILRDRLSAHLNQNDGIGENSRSIDGNNIDQFKRWSDGSTFPILDNSDQSIMSKEKSHKNNRASQYAQLPNEQHHLIKYPHQIISDHEDHGNSRDETVALVTNSKDTLPSSSKDYESIPIAEPENSNQNDLESLVTTDAPGADATSSLVGPTGPVQSTTLAPVSNHELQDPEEEEESVEANNDDRNVGPDLEDNHESNEQAHSRDEPESNKIDNESMQRVKKTVHSIDEEVDKMTQPSSSGLVLQQDSPFDVRGAVQFDDNVNDNHYATNITPPKYQSADLEEDHHADRGQTNTTEFGSGNNKWTPRAKVERKDLDLVVGHAALQPTILQSKLIKPHYRDLQSKDPSYLSEWNNKSFLNLINSISRLKSIEPRDNLNQNQHLMRHKRSSYKRRNDNDEQPEDEGDDGDGDDDTDSNEGNHEELNHGLFGIGAPRSNNEYPKITTTEPTLQELLAHKQLLDALQLDKKHPPAVSLLSSSNATTSTGIQIPNQDHQSAGTQFSVDHGLLLYPASGEDDGHKSVSKNGSKSAKKKAKKKMTVAMKKGGHRKKKQKKEEKKYHKEKKFKGAKKGKKMKKGKGGKGGKKGSKFYKDKGFKKKGFKNIYVKNEFGQKKSYFDEFRDKDFKKKWKNFDDKYNYAQMKKWQAKELKGAKKLKDHAEKMKKYDKSKWKKKYLSEKNSESSSKKKKKEHDF